MIDDTRSRLLLLLVIPVVLVGLHDRVWAADRVYVDGVSFEIPFRVDRPTGTADPGPIRLFVSADHGRSWSPAGGATAAAGRFAYQAAGDGEYWFTVRTRGQAVPRDTRSADLRVVVDTRPPEFRIVLSQPQPGQVRLEWNAADANLDPASLVLEYRGPADDRWRTVAMPPSAAGHTTWAIPGGGPVAARGRVADHSGNVVRAAARRRVEPDRQRPSSSDRVPIFPGERRPVATDPDRPWTAAVPGPAPRWRRCHVIGTRRFRVDCQPDRPGDPQRRLTVFISRSGRPGWQRWPAGTERPGPLKIEVPGDGVYRFAFVWNSTGDRAAAAPSADRPADLVVVVDRSDRRR